MFSSQLPPSRVTSKAVVVLKTPKLNRGCRTMTCIICEQRPAHGNGNGFCQNCNSKLESQHRRKNSNRPKHFLTYRGQVVGLFHDGKGTLKARLLKRSHKGLPKGKTLDLDHWCEGFTREQVKSFKACVLRLASA